MSDLDEWFGEVENLGVAAEHGYFIKDPKTKEVKNMGQQTQSLETIEGWKNLIRDTLSFYVDSTEGSYLEDKKSALVWNYARTDPYLGQLQAKELNENLDSILTNQAVEVAMGKSIVEVKPRGCNKGVVAQLMIQGDPDFIFCVGDDRSDEDMFKVINEYSKDVHKTFVCTVGQKPSRAHFYINDSSEVIRTLSRLTEVHPHYQKRTLPRINSNSG